MLSHLEHVVLGVVSNKQPCTAYAVRMVFQESLSAHWSGSAGAIYPLLRRLEKGGLLRSTPRKGDGRATRLYRLTAKGRGRFRTWLRPPLPPGSGLMNMDPLRVRVLFLGALDDTERKAVIEEAQAKLRDLLRHIENDVRQSREQGDTYEYLVGRGAALSVRAQLKWLSEVENA